MVKKAEVLELIPDLVREDVTECEEARPCKTDCDLEWACKLLAALNSPTKRKSENKQEIVGIRKSCTTGEMRIVKLRYRIHEDEKMDQWIQLVGGPTGYESVSVNGLRKLDRGWMANVRTKTLSGVDEVTGKSYYHPGWDGLYIPRAEIERLLERLALTNEETPKCKSCNREMSWELNQRNEGYWFCHYCQEHKTSKKKVK
jgi:hypothetical protein